MLSKINNNKINYMKIAISLAKERIGLTGSNPSVGCVVVKNKEIISVGQTGLNGTPHAEVDALNKAKSNAIGATLYVSLEPCSHYGKTPPCTNKIIKSKIKKVYYAIHDIDERSSYKCNKILKKHKISVSKNLLFKSAQRVYKSYFVNKKHSLPFVTGKIACSKNYVFKSKSKYITNEHSLKVSHILRYKNQGILISHITANADNPNLNCRLNGLEKFSPVRFVLDKNLNIKLNLNLIKTSKKIETYIFYNKKNNKFNKLKSKGVKLIYCPLTEDNKLDLFFILKKIKDNHVNTLLVEGGYHLTNVFLKKKLFNEFYLFKSNKNLNSDNYKIKNLNKLLMYFRNIENMSTFLDKDKVIKYY